MLENLFNLIKEQGSDAVINNPEVPNEQNNAVLASATQSVAEEFQGVLAGGGLSNIMSLFGGGGSNGGGISSLLSNPIVGSIISSFTNKLTNQHGIGANQASGIAGSLIPGVISSLINRTQDPNDSGFNMNSLIGSLTGGGSQHSGFDLQGLLGNFTGGGQDVNGDGQVDMSDIIAKVTSGAQQQQSNGGGGLMDMIQGFLK
ncbi:MAG: hypothetical protein RL172_181 [Bacteroidota bacterium]|jgi:uncharacterized membrane protein YeaQ/YmgE (transglycosylase-associated protein family)